MLQKTIQSLFKASFRTVDLIAPALAGRWGMRLFFSPMRFKRPEREAALLENADRRQVAFEGFYSRPATESYYVTYRWGHGPAVLLVHGWSGRGSQMGFLVQPLIEAGYQVITFDAPAHGDSPGRQTNILEFIQIIREIEQEVGGFVAIVGHSLGGVAAGLAIQRGVQAQKLITLGSPASMDFVLSSFAEQINASDRSLRYLRDYLTQLANNSLDDFSLHRVVAQLKTPGLIIHDREDRNVAYDQSQLLAESWPEARLISTTGLGHNRTLRSPEVIAEIGEFIGPAQPVSVDSLTFEMPVIESEPN